MTYRDEFPQSVRKAAFARADGVCECGCGVPFNYSDPKGCPVYDHEIPAKLGGGNDLGNCKCIRLDCHKAKTAAEDMPKITKVRREDKRRHGLEKTKAKIAGSKGTKWKRTIDGRTVLRD